MMLRDGAENAESLRQRGQAEVPASGFIFNSPRIEQRVQGN
jgi:hypothetical protein